VNLTKPLFLNGSPIGGGKEPLICTPLVAKHEQSVLRELAAVVAKSPDIIEWRVDFFEGIADSARVVALAEQIKQGAGGIPLIFTRRSIREGGENIALDEPGVLALYQAVCAAKCIDFVDYELSSNPVHFSEALAAAHQAGVQLIASFHNFRETPPVEEIVGKFFRAQMVGANIAKVAVMPRAIEDVLVLLAATLEGNRTVKLPIISMSMGPYGSLSRLFGWAFGSSVTFAVGGGASAPGQIPIEELRVVLEILQRSLSTQQD
jgi:3-dehydroquinate dehydratase-1